MVSNTCENNWYMTSNSVLIRFLAHSWYKSLGLDESLPEVKRKDRKDEALNILKAGIEANPGRCVIVSLCPLPPFTVAQLPVEFCLR